MSYELAIVLFVIVFGLLFVVLNYSFLYQPFLELTIFFGIVISVLGIVKRDYDVLFTGILFFVMGLVLLSMMPSYVPVPPGGKEGVVINVLWPLLAPLGAAYAFGPLALGVVLILAAWALSRIK